MSRTITSDNARQLQLGAPVNVGSIINRLAFAWLGRKKRRDFCGYLVQAAKLPEGIRPDLMTGICEATVRAELEHQ
jgi:hypothetical protein